MDPDARVWPALKTRQGSGECAASVYSLSVPVNYPQRTGGGGDGVGCAASDGSLMVPGFDLGGAYFTDSSCNCHRELMARNKNVFICAYC